MTWLGVVADDVTGATDIAGTLVARGLRVVQTFGLPEGEISECDCVVVALKIRTVPAAEAVASALAAARRLRELGAEQIFFKYCSTFDSTDSGNIGPVADALQTDLGARISLVCPATPTIGRTVYFGHLFVNGRLLSESSLRNHPLTPMTDPDLVRVLGRQTTSDVALIDYSVVERGADSVRSELERLAGQGVRYAVADALRESHLAVLGEAVRDHRLVTGASGLAWGLASARFASRARVVAAPVDEAILRAPAAVVSGSCSEATREQVALFAARHPAFAVDPIALAEGQDVVGAALEFVAAHLDGPVLIHSAADVRRAQSVLGTLRAAELVESALAGIATGLVELGVRRMIVAGGETSGAVVRALGITGVRVGAEVDPGVPWTFSLDGRLALLLKSGNLGRPSLFGDAWDALT
ncbi:four-carbon acid sugar kinase family protein [Allokutzneria sp. A3M-2-11 16]|uniref:3-oxo-tetronate kinase n=1 Tax=Allokutzneria sp. A3M-2-11 16 TaxID=2962043 RepID=UPI0020B765C2|nr:3-oxo-tetronate kinase [Allokutzneria sp. A3M-2-11 16]MCP3804601.1 four-carbon acid sugar kinase family protein [Allokutzneria sp. A3M-2-11 16]